MLTYEERRDRARVRDVHQARLMNSVFLAVVLGGLGYQAFDMWRYQRSHPAKHFVGHRSPDDFGAIRWDGHKWVGR